MQQEKVKRETITLLGLTVRTNNRNETNPATAKIGPLAGFYWSEQVAKQFPTRLNPGVTYAVYTEYESDEYGDYTYFIGEQIDPNSIQNKGQFTQLIIPAGCYQKFTTAKGKMPAIVINAWQEIWQMKAQALGGKRTYQADFEIYDQRAHDFQQAIVDIYISITENA